MTAAPTAGGVVTSGVGVAGVGVGLLGMFGPVRVVHVGWLLPLSGVHIELDRLGGFFMALTGAVAAPVGCYLIGYVRREHLGRVPMAVVPLFVAAMLLVPAAGSVTTFLLAWELMAIASLILVLSEHARPQVRSAGLWYAVMTQLGFIAILVGLVVLAAAGGSDRFAGLGAVCDGVRAAVFMLTLVGFGSKAGLVPLHAWLPRAHPEAPSPVSALMSAAMVNLGIYGIVRFDLQLLGPGPRWWGLALLAVGGTSALYGVLQASVAADLKRLLAYSTTENMGLITLALGAATLFADTGAYGPASIAAAAAMLHMIAHAAFKSRRRPAPARLPLWACGAADLTVRMQYTATSFAEPLQRVFGDVLRPDTDIEVTHTAESRYMAERITYRTAVADAIEQRLYTPVVGAVAAMAELLRRAHTGSVHRYLAYGALGVLIVLVVAR